MSTLSLPVCLPVESDPSFPVGKKQSLSSRKAKMAAGERRAVGGDRTGAGLDVRRLSMVHRANKSGKWKILHHWSEK